MRTNSCAERERELALLHIYEEGALARVLVTCTDTTAVCFLVYQTSVVGISKLNFKFREATTTKKVSSDRLAGG